ncbi:hypothetical protein SISNIDRAFT_465910 [Sistotremastrum niveocremeum HHB9708]|uniref:Fungal-type protein kinase domain-containing protein n=1 Tax=Sistotremastrum niveocremeum HHB9708 TaxID=1314777 RepID=A0A164V1Z0_9AGAM|nr:hypothetical protein SISNIDRAFT_465910 [Sistotremastrum niveocremeum HHB9708]
MTSHPTTPVKMKPLPPADTPIHSSSSPLLKTKPVKQEVLQKQMKAELRDSVAVSSKLREELILLSPFSLDLAIKMAQKLKDSATGKLRDWPEISSSQKEETKLYPPILRLCSYVQAWVIRQSMGREPNDQDPCFMKTDTRVMVNPMKELGLLKPDIIFGHDHALPAKFTNTLSFVNVKIGNWEALIAQSSTYARAYFAYQPDLVMLYALLMDPVQARFARFDRSGLILSESLHIAADLVDLVRGLSGLIRKVADQSVRDVTLTCVPAPNGLRNQISISGAPIGELLINRVLYSSICVRGRATRTYEVFLPNNTLALLKDSWRDQERTPEGTILRRCSGFYGLPQIIGDWTSGASTAYPDTTSYHTSPLRREVRVQYRILMLPVGKPLSDYRDEPGVVLLAIYDAILGHWTLLCDRLVHRDISSENIIVFDKPRKLRYHPKSSLPRRIPLEMYNEEGSAMLADLDMAVEYDPTGKRLYPALDRRTGAAAFMSTRLLYRKGLPQQNMFDDLESFFWALVWVAFGISVPSDYTPTKEEEQEWEDSIEYQVRKCINNGAQDKFGQISVDKEAFLGERAWSGGMGYAPFDPVSAEYIPVCKRLYPLILARRSLSLTAAYQANEQTRAYTDTLRILREEIERLQENH